MAPNESTAAHFARLHDGFTDVADGVERVWVTCAPGEAETIAADAAGRGLQHTRTLLQLRRPLPVTDRPPAPLIQTRAFRPEVDLSAWVEANNAAFAWHPDQGHQTVESLLAQMAEPWYDPEGFRILELDGTLAGFCWTKVHEDETPPLGEIYVIATAPEFAGRGLGLALTLDGLDHLFAVRGVTEAMLYVESDNTAALRTYDRLGFDHHLTRMAFVAGPDEAADARPSQRP